MLPGGGVEPAEDGAAAAIRELVVKFEAMGEFARDALSPDVARARRG